MDWFAVAWVGCGVGGIAALIIWFKIESDRMNAGK